MSVNFACDDRHQQWRWTRALHRLTSHISAINGRTRLHADDLLTFLRADDIAPGIAVTAMRSYLRRQCHQAAGVTGTFAALSPAAIAYELWQRTRDADVLAEGYAVGVQEAGRLSRAVGPPLARLSALGSTQLALVRLAAARADTHAVGIWRQRAEATRRTLMQRHYHAGEACFYEADRQPCLRPLALEPLLAGLVDPPTLQRIWQRHFATPDQRRRIWSPLTPFPGLIAVRWLERSGQLVAHGELLQGWLTAPLADSMPELIHFTEAMAGLHGIQRQAGGVAWNCRPMINGSRHHYHLDAADVGELELRQHRHSAELRLGGTLIAEVQGTCRVITDTRGRVAGVVGTAPTTAAITLTCDGATQQLTVEPNAWTTL